MITVYTDGACRVSNPGETSCAFVVYSDEKEIYHEGFYLGPQLHTNNFAEYMGVINALEWVKYNGPDGVTVYCDSKLVVEQTCGSWQCLKPDLKPLMYKIRRILLRGRHRIVHIDGHAGHVGNERADEICNDVLDKVQGKGKYEKT